MRTAKKTPQNLINATPTICRGDSTQESTADCSRVSPPPDERSFAPAGVLHPHFCFAKLTTRLCAYSARCNIRTVFRPSAHYTASTSISCTKRMHIGERLPPRSHTRHCTGTINISTRRTSTCPQGCTLLSREKRHAVHYNLATSRGCKAPLHTRFRG